MLTTDGEGVDNQYSPTIFTPFGYCHFYRRISAPSICSRLSPGFQFRSITYNITTPPH